jgi:hypothetical protein
LVESGPRLVNVVEPAGQQSGVVATVFGDQVAIGRADLGEVARALQPIRRLRFDDRLPDSAYAQLFAKINLVEQST